MKRAPIQHGISRDGVLVLVFLALVVSGPARAEDKAAGKNGVTTGGEEKGTTPAVISSPGIQAEIHGCVNLDYVGFENAEKSIKDVGSQENNIFVRRARIVLAGKLWNYATFNIQTALEIPNSHLIDAYVTLPVTNSLDFRAGQMKLPFSEERLKSYLHQVFMERSLAANLELRRSQGAYFVSHPGNGWFNGYLGMFTGEAMSAPNTDDDFEYNARMVFMFDKMMPDFPGAAKLGMSAARGRRVPERIGNPTNSFTGKTMNELVFFSPVPVNGWRTRYESDFEWRYRTLWIAGEWIKSEEERDDVDILLDTNGDGKSEETVNRDLDPLQEQGWMAYLVWQITGEPVSDKVVPARNWGALQLVSRYSVVTFNSPEDSILGTTLPGREVSLASSGLGRPSLNETVRDLYVGFNWDIKSGVFIQVATIWQWFDESLPKINSDHAGDHSDVNYRARVGVAF